MTAIRSASGKCVNEDIREPGRGPLHLPTRGWAPTAWGLALALSATLATDAEPVEPTIARLSLWTGEAQRQLTSAAYEELASPALATHGLRALPRQGRPTAPGVAHWLYELDDPARVPALAGVLAADPAWTKARLALSKRLSAEVPPAPLDYRFEVYSAPAAPAYVRPFGAGRGHWRTFGPREGIQPGTVTDIVEDRHGDLWVGTEGGGLSRFDGQEFEIINTESGLCDDRITDLEIDDAGHLWVATHGGGVCHFDGEAWRTLTAADGLADDWVWGVVQAQDGAYWFATESGVSQYEGGVFTTHTAANGLAQDVCSTVFESSTGDLWVGTYGAGVSRWRDGAWQTYTVDDGLAYGQVLRISEDRSGGIWFATRGRGAGRLKDGTWTTVSVEQGLIDFVARHVVEDDEGALWFAMERGVCRRTESGWETFEDQPGAPRGFTRVIHEGRNGVLWIGSSEGLVRYDPHTFRVYTGAEAPLPGMLWDVLDDGHGDMWITSRMSGVGHLVDGDMHVYTANEGLTSNVMLDVARDRRGGVWFSSPLAGLTHYDGQQFSTYSTADGLGAIGIRTIYEDTTGTLWFGSHDAGVTCHDPVSGRWATYNREHGLPGDEVLSMSQDERGMLWLGTGFGIAQLDLAGWACGDEVQLQTFAAEEALNDRYIIAVEPDTGGVVWVGTLSGAARYEPEAAGGEGGGRWTLYDMSDGLGGSWVAGFLRDRRGMLWLTTYDGGMARFDGEVFQSVNHLDGLGGNTICNILEDEAGDIWVANGGYGLTRYRQPPPPPSNAVRVRTMVGDRRLGQVPAASFPSTVSLLAFDLAVQDFRTRPEAMVYRYRLRGHEDEWSTTHQRRVEYTDLPRGDYTFEVQAVNRDLVYSEHTGVRVSVRAPWARVGLAVALTLALGASIAASAYGLRSRAERNRAQRERADALEEANARLREADQLKSDFVANVSHELRTPLTAMRGAVDNMLDGITGELQPRQLEYLERMRSNHGRLNRLIEDLLDLSRIEAGYLELHLLPLAAEEVARSVVETFAPMASQASIDLSLSPPPTAAPVYADPDRLQQILSNLVNNALKFTPAGGAVAVTVDRTESAARFTVSDTGPGIEPQALERIFEKFHQVEGAAGPRGAGIGLSIVRSLVGMMGGRIWVESEVGVGSAFHVELPADGRAGSGAVIDD